MGPATPTTWKVETAVFLRDPSDRGIPSGQILRGQVQANKLILGCKIGGRPPEDGGDGALGTYHPMLRLATVRWPDAVEANRHAIMIDVRIMARIDKIK